MNKPIAVTKREYVIKYISELMRYILTPCLLLTPWGWEALVWYIYVIGCIRSRVNPFTRVAMVSFFNLIQETYDSIDKEEKIKSIRRDYIDQQWNTI